MGMQEGKLSQAVYEDWLDEAAKALANGADINDPKLHPNFGSALHIAATVSNPAMVEFLIRHGANVNARHYRTGDVPLHCVAARSGVRYDGAEEVTRLLVEAGAVVTAQSNDGGEPLDRAAGNGNAEICKLLISAGAHVNKTEGALGGKGIPLHSAVAKGHLKTVRLLIDAGADVNAVSRHGETPLHIAARGSSMDVYRLLVAAGASESMRDDHGRDPLATALGRINSPLASELLQAGFDAGYVDRHNNNLLHEAAAGGAVSCVAALVQAGVPIHQLNTSLCTPLHRAVAEGFFAAAKELVRCGADPSFTPEPASLAYLTPFQEAVKSGAVEMVKYFVLESGEDPAQRTRAGRTMHQLAGKDAEMKDLLRALKTDRAVSAAMGAGVDLGATSTKKPSPISPL